MLSDMAEVTELVNHDAGTQDAGAANTPFSPYKIVQMCREAEA